MHKLLFSVGLSGKTGVADAGAGGSYGFGKGVFMRASRLKTVFAYTAFREEGGGLQKRLLGAAYLAQHRYEGVTWAGWCRFGPGSEADQPEAVEGRAADELAQALGFAVRGEEEEGTSLLIVDTPADPDRLRRGIEKWWWPRLEAGQLHVEVQNTDGTTLYPSPREREHLRPFVECYRLALGVSTPQGEHQRTGAFNRVHGLPLGRWALQLLEAPQEDPDDEESEAASLRGTVALIRVPGMVVQYHQPVKRIAPNVVGVFVADREVDHILRLSEPPNHDRWDSNSGRLADCPVGQDVARAAVDAIFKRLREQYRRFARDAAPAPSDPVARLPFLEELLGRFFRVTQRGPEPVTGQGDKVSIVFERGPSVSYDGADSQRAIATIRLELRPDASEDELDATVVARAPIQERGTGAREDVPVHLYLDGQRGSGSLPIRLRKGVPRRIEIETDRYDPDWSIELLVEVRDVASE